MIRCPGCSARIYDIRELTEVGSLGLALRGKCPVCEGWVWCQDLWKKTAFIDATNPRLLNVTSSIRMQENAG